MKSSQRCLLLAILVDVSLVIPAFATVSIDWASIGNPGNAAQSAANRAHGESLGDGLGAVADTYKIAKNETTISQYADFLNAVAKTDTYGLYRTNMASDANVTGIARDGSSGNYNNTVTGSGDRPITCVSWFDAARFCNWLHHGQQTGLQTTGTTEGGAYTLLGANSGTGFIKNLEAKVWIPSESEWHKAAHYDPSHMSGAGGYWLHANRSDSMTSNDSSVSGAANFLAGDFETTPGNNTLSPSQNYLTDAGAYGTDSQSYYGINDMAGNVWELIDAINLDSRIIRGGAWTGGEGYLRSSYRGVTHPTSEYPNVGFRLATVSEPTSLVLTMLASGVMLIRRKR